MPSLKDRDLNSSWDSTASLNTSSEKPATRQQPVALEVPVVVNGERPLEGSEKREPFSESTKTVLLFDNGAVVRLASGVAPGQLLVLIHEKTKKEVVCQVVKSKNYSNVSGYVEVEFTEASPGFWGLTFPGDHSALKHGFRAQGDSSEVSRLESNPPTVVAQTAVSALAEKLKSDERASNRADLLASTETEDLKHQANRLQEELSALMFTKQQNAQGKQSSSSDHKALREGTAKLFDKAEAALKTEELKTPAWLEPSARNTPTPAPAQEPAPKSNAREERKKPEAPEVLSKRADRKPDTVRAAAAFGDALPRLSAAVSTPSHGNKKGVLLAAMAASILIVATAAAWYLRQPSSPTPSSEALTRNPAPSTIPTAAVTESAAAVSRSQPTQNDAPQRIAAQLLEQKLASAVVPERPSSLSPAAPLKVQPAAISERVSQPAAADPAPAGAHDVSADSLEPEPKKPSLGTVRLVHPKVSRSGQANGVVQPTFPESEPQAAPADAALSAPLLGENVAQPAAPPIPVGGEVKPARLLSSVPPIYPPMAKNQHISGGVRIDAVIDANGRVSSMKVVSGPTLLQPAAMQALRQWKYQPATLDGNAVPMHLDVTIQFRLQ